MGGSEQLNLRRLVRPIVKAMVDRVEGLMLVNSDPSLYVAMVRSGRSNLLAALANEAEEHTNGEFSIREIPRSYVHGAEIRRAPLVVTLCAVRKYHRPRGRMVALPAPDEMMYTIGVTADGRVAVSMFKFKSKKRRR